MTCPCGAGDTYERCCGRLHAGAVEASTAEQLLRSRYSAHVVLDEAYVLRTCHPATRPVRVELDPTTEWLGLEIRSISGGHLLDLAAVVEFTARYRQDGRAAELTERSRFQKDGGRWFYVAAEG